MDVIVNSNIQSPLVRTLARTKSKSESFTNHIKDNVPPVSFSKLVLDAEGGSTGGYGRNYKFKIPQYGYWRNSTLRFQSNDLPIPADLIKELQVELETIDTDLLPSLSRSRTGAGTAEPNTLTNMWHAYVPYEEGNEQEENQKDPWVQLWIRLRGGEDLGATTRSATGGARMVPFRYDVRNDLMAIQWYQRSDGTNYNNTLDYLSEGPTYGNGVPSSTPQISKGTGCLMKSGQGKRVMNTWDWCSQSNLSKYLGAIIPERIELSTHNRPIQTIYPLQTVMQIHRMSTDDKERYLSMLRPVLEDSPSNTPRVIGVGGYGREAVDSHSTDRVWYCYFPLFLSFFEEPSRNLDTRFVESLEIDVTVRKDTDIFFFFFLGDRAAELDGTAKRNYGGILSNRGLHRIFGGALDTIRHRRLARVVSTQITVQLINYYYNFHDSTSQAIRDANFKPNVPLNLLTYNTYAENPVNLTADTLRNGGTININLTCNNLIQGISFMVRRRAYLATDDRKYQVTAFQDLLTTLPIKRVTLSGSGQQLYTATGHECLMIDQFDYPLSSMKSGKNYTNTSALYADNMASSTVHNKQQTDHFFAYYIPFGFSQDKTYQSGSVAMQTINNPTLSIEFFPLDGWTIQDDSLAFKRSQFFNQRAVLADRSDSQDILVDNEFEIAIFEDFWQVNIFIHLYVFINILICMYR